MTSNQFIHKTHSFNRKMGVFPLDSYLLTCFLTDLGCKEIIITITNYRVTTPIKLLLQLGLYNHVACLLQ